MAFLDNKKSNDVAKDDKYWTDDSLGHFDNF